MRAKIKSTLTTTTRTTTTTTTTITTRQQSFRMVLFYFIVVLLRRRVCDGHSHGNCIAILVTDIFTSCMETKTQKFRK